MTRSLIHIGRFSDAITIKDDLTLKSDLFCQIEDVLGFVKKHINKELKLRGHVAGQQSNGLWPWYFTGKIKDRGNTGVGG
jgi:predicted HTH transcriptional regulator